MDYQKPTLRAINTVQDACADGSRASTAFDCLAGDTVGAQCKSGSSAVLDEAGTACYQDGLTAVNLGSGAGCIANGAAAGGDCLWAGASAAATSCGSGGGAASL